jgi:sigma-B regulation protein RsbU (phosphoserine phosphatase)
MIQRALLPAGPLRGRGVEVAHKFRPLAEVGGDFLDYFWLPGGKVGLYIGDVVGKRLPAALYASLAMGILRGLNKTGETPAAIVRMLNQRLLERAVPERFCMLVFALFDPATRTLAFTNAGLPRPLHLAADGCRELGADGMPCGLMEEASYEMHIVRLTPGDTVLLMTDGLGEAARADGELFGLERLIRVCAAHRGHSAAALLDRVFAAVETFSGGASPHDDQTACALRVE